MCRDALAEDDNERAESAAQLASGADDLRSASRCSARRSDAKSFCGRRRRFLTSLPMYTVGAFVYALRGERFLALRRAGGRGAGWWGLPGGAVEAGESFEEAAARELTEESGLRAQAQLHLISATRIQIESQPVIQLHYASQCDTGEVTLSWEHSTFDWVTVDEYREMALGANARALAGSGDARSVLDAAAISLDRFAQWLGQALSQRVSNLPTAPQNSRQEQTRAASRLRAAQPPYR